MNRIRKLEVVLDADDVLIECNSYALDLLKENVSAEEASAISIDHITDWGLLQIPEDKRLTYLNDPYFYLHQPPVPGAGTFLKDLSEIAEITIMTAVYPRFMGERIQRLNELFPDFPLENIIMGKRKEMLQADVMLDDGLHNLLSSGSSLPVLYRRPWNRKASGICSVKNYSEFLTLIQILAGNSVRQDQYPYIFCIVGPSGSGKHRFAQALCQNDLFTQIFTCTTAECCGRNRHLTREDFEKLKQEGSFLESTYYCGEQYGIVLEDICNAIDQGKNSVAVMDISGCMAIHNRFPGRARILFVESDKRECVSAILRKENLPHDHRVDRILSIDLEQKNKVLADFIIRPSSDGSFQDAAARILETCRL